MKRGTVILIGLVALALIGTAGYFGFRSTQPAVVPTPSAPQTVPVTRGDVRQAVSSPGQLVTTRQVDLALDVGGRLKEVQVRPGDRVQKGDVLARLETDPLEQAVAQADVNVRLAQLDLAAAREGPGEAELAAARTAVRGAFGPRYLTLAGAPKPLYGQERVQGSSGVFVVEGLIDYLLLWQWGYPAVATLGSRLKREYVEFLRGFPRVYLVPHRGDAGRQMWRECKDAFGDRLRTVLVPEGMEDVGDLARKAAAPARVFARLVDEAR